MLSDVTVQNQREDFDFQAGGRSVKGVRTTFTVGRDGPFSVFVPDDEFTPAENLKRIEARADAVRGVREHPGLKTT
jgi:hypothetical protein